MTRPPADPRPDPDRVEELAVVARRAAAAGDAAAVRAALEERAARIRALPAGGPGAARALAALERARSIDAETEALLRTRLAGLGRDLRALGLGRRGLSGYAGSAGRAGSRIDERG
jgi:hypothetical protein